MLTADPRVVPDARVIPQLNAREAAELAYYGAKVLHPRALIPLGRPAIPLFVRPFADPGIAGHGGLRSGAPLARRHRSRRLGASRAGARHRAGNGMLGVPGIAARTFAALQRAGISVSLISQASSEPRSASASGGAGRPTSRGGARAGFADEIARREIDGVEVESGLATVAVVGLGMAGTPGIAARVFSALAARRHQHRRDRAGLVGAQHLGRGRGARRGRGAAPHPRARSSSPIGGGAVTRPEQADVVLLGFGQIGRTLAGCIAARPAARRSRCGSSP